MVSDICFILFYRVVSLVSMTGAILHTI